MEPQNAGVLSGDEGDGKIKFGSGLHEPNVIYGEPAEGCTPFNPESAVYESEPVSEEVQRKPEAPAPEQQAYIDPDGQVHEVPPELIGPDGKMLPLNERTVAMLRGKYFTVRHDMMSCGHKIDRMNQPKTNCEICWWNWLNTHGELVKVADEFYRQYGAKRLVAMRGKVFVKMFLRFMSTVQHIMAEQKAQESNL